ncbi:MAG TPA: sigma-70 family RNA polymerase sigma factor [Vineibacter sp.]|nr:sigma-70 family RNA polymerase sigma factor [Vineibacter sp.]
MTTAATNTFHEDLKAILPRLRLHALSLTHDRDRADDLVQETVVKALAAQASYRPGCFGAWLFRIQRNEFISGLRRARPCVPLDDSIGEMLSHPAPQDSALATAEFLVAFGRLTPAQREALVLSVVDGQSYDAIARTAGVSVGTIKSRVSRGRDTLERLLTGEVAIATAPDKTSGAHRGKPARRASRGNSADRVFGTVPA